MVRSILRRRMWSGCRSSFYVTVRLLGVVIIWRPHLTWRPWIHWTISAHIGVDAWGSFLVGEDHVKTISQGVIWYFRLQLGGHISNCFEQCSFFNKLKKNWEGFFPSMSLLPSLQLTHKKDWLQGSFGQLNVWECRFQTLFPVVI